jgi:signal transduction histidine kinase
MRRRVQRLALASALLVLLVFGLPLAFAVRLVYLNDERAELARVAEQAAAAVSPEGLRGADPVELPQAEQDTDVGLYAKGKGLVAGRGPARADAAVSGALRGSLTEGRTDGVLLVAVPVRDGESIAGAVRIAARTGAVTHRTWLTWGAMAGLSLLALGAATVLARRQTRRLAAPLVELAAVAAALGDGDFTVRAPPSGIPEIDRAATALNHTALRLDELVTRERALGAGASHQLRTPLTGLRLVLEAGRNGDEATLRSAAATAIEATDQLERTIDDLLTVTAQDRPTGPERRLDVQALLDELETERVGPLGLQGRPLRVRRDPQLPHTTASASTVRQILAVLVDNACEHGQGVITVRARDAGDALAVDVSDEGDGPGPAAALFSRDADRAPGHGLGLPLAHALAEAEGGRLVLTHAGPHPRFTLFLPAAG